MMEKKGVRKGVSGLCVWHNMQGGKRTRCASRNSSKKGNTGLREWEIKDTAQDTINRAGDDH